MVVQPGSYAHRRNEAIPRYRTTPYRARFRSTRLRSLAVTRRSWNMKSATVASRRSDRSTPYRSRARSPEIASAVSRRVLLGSVPVLVEAPPTNGLFSIIATRLPKSAAAAAPLSPAGPDPITIRSYEIGSMQAIVPRCWRGAKMHHPMSIPQKCETWRRFLGNHQRSAEHLRRLGYDSLCFDLAWCNAKQGIRTIGADTRSPRDHLNMPELL